MVNPDLSIVGCAKLRHHKFRRLGERKIFGREAVPFRGAILRTLLSL